MNKNICSTIVEHLNINVTRVWQSQPASEKRAELHCALPLWYVLRRKSSGTVLVKHRWCGCATIKLANNVVCKNGNLKIMLYWNKETVRENLRGTGVVQSGWCRLRPSTNLYFFIDTVLETGKFPFLDLVTLLSPFSSVLRREADWIVAGSQFRHSLSNVWK